MKRVIIVPEINPFNFIVYVVLSLFSDVRTSVIKPYFLSRIMGRITLLDIAEYMSWEEVGILRGHAVKAFLEALKNFPVNLWQVGIKSARVDLSLKAKQELQKEFETLIFLQEITKADETAGWVIIHSIRHKYLSFLGATKTFVEFKTNVALNILQNVSERLYIKLLNCSRFLRIIFEYGYGAVSHKKIPKGIRYFSCGIPPRELSIGEDNITYMWMIDGQTIKLEEMFFILPIADFQMKKFKNTYKKVDGLNASIKPKMNSYALRRIIFENFVHALKLFLHNIFSSAKFEELFKTEYSFRILEWLPIIESLKPNVYLVGDCHLLREEPVVLYLRKTGIKTVMWICSVNSYTFLNECKKDVYLNKFDFANILSEWLVVWNEDYKEFILELPQDGLKVRAIGPLMSGNEGVMSLPKERVCEKIGLPGDVKKINICVFDMPPVSKKFLIKHRGHIPKFSFYFTEELNYRFMHDMFNLLEDIPDIRLIYKPKRNLTSGKFFYDENLRKVFDDMAKHDDAIILDYNINPWIPLALADICISLPFSSPTVAAYHYNKCGLFYDPINKLACHRYNKIDKLLVRSYPDLKKIIEEYITAPHIYHDYVNRANIKEFLGGAIGENSSDNFRDFLRNL